MTINEVKALFKKHYQDAGLQLIDEHPEELFFARGSANWHVDSDDLNEYLKLEPQFATFEVQPNDCSICAKDYREQALTSIDIVPTAWLSGLGPKELVYGDPSTGAPYAVIGRASPLFRAYFRFKPDFFKWSLSRLHDPGRGRTTRMALRERITRPPVIRVERLPTNSVGDAIKVSDEIISGCLFQLAALKGLPQQIRTKWGPKKNLAATGISPQDTEAERNQLPLLKVTPIRDLVNLYTLGAGTHYAPLKFLAYYQILEYFFLKIADEQLYERLRRRMTDLLFRYVPKDLDRVIQDVLDHRRETDETEMLKCVLGKFLDEADVIAFIRDFEERLGSTPYTKKRTLFGTDVQVALSPGHVFGTVAKTIKTIRNALVHSSDRHERRERYVPFSANEELIAGEVPLIRYLAEKVIIATATPVP